ncbi:MAG: GbsR/MarR family transcriptional regulator [Deltaproteobacteria bacterium]
MADWERLAADAVGTTIEAWGFKLNHGRVWSLLYIRDRALSAAEIQGLLGLSKGAVSMVTNELERWGVLHRVRQPGDTPWRFRAETDLGEMIARVIAEREAKLVSRVENDLLEAHRRARTAGAERSRLERLTRLGAVAHAMQLAVHGFLATSRFDVRSVAKLLAAEAVHRARRGRSAR